VNEGWVKEKEYEKEKERLIKEQQYEHEKACVRQRMEKKV
jgi:hypothetical protein